MIILGGGPIGLELAQAFQRLGCDVTVVENAPRILMREDEDVSAFMLDFLKGEGLTVKTATKVTKVAHDGESFFVTIEEDGVSSILQAQAFLVAAGRQPNSEGLALEKAGVQTSQQGIKVDARMRTNVSHIFACGDINGQLPFTHVASYEAVIAVYNAIIKVFAPKADYRTVPWVTYLDPEVASIGYNEARAKADGIQYVKHIEKLDHHDRALAEGENYGFIKMLLHQNGRVIGVQIVGSRAGDLLAEWIPIINKKLKLSAISDAIHPYPTMAEINKNASVNYLVSTIPAWSTRLIKFLFGYQGKS